MEFRLSIARLFAIFALEKTLMHPPARMLAIKNKAPTFMQNVMGSRSNETIDALPLCNLITSPETIPFVPKNMQTKLTINILITATRSCTFIAAVTFPVNRS
jgi:hypothetical protein